MKSLEGKVAIITGAGGGQGAAEAALFVKEGAKVIATDIVFENVQKVVDRINDDYPESAVALKHDVASEEQWKEVASEVMKKFGQLHILVNNAGILATKPYEETGIDYWNLGMNINAWSQFVGMKTVAPYIKEAGGGSIVNVGSLASINSAGGFNVYTASKGAVEAMTRSAAVQFGPDKIRVNSIHPGAIATKMLTDTVTTDEAMDKVKANIPLRRVGEPRDVAKLALFLASNDSSYISGTANIIDGAMRL
ncbi:MAG: SDR family oxidoreductase [Kurthia sp.]|nr:SDR family oxidoreductase [Candidatus Kurthia equi]